MSYCKTTFTALVLVITCLPAMIIAQDSYYLQNTAWNDTVGERFAKQAAFEFVERDPSLPDVLLVGNSISIGYTSSVRSMLEGIANVHYSPEGSEKLGMHVAKIIKEHL